MPAGERYVPQEQRRHHHDAQRPEVVDQVGLHRWRMAQGDEEQEVEAEQAVDPESQRAEGHAPLAEVEARERQRDQAADQQREPGEQKGRHVRQGHTECGEGGPQRDRAQGKEVGVHADRLPCRACIEVSAASHARHCVVMRSSQRHRTIAACSMSIWSGSTRVAVTVPPPRRSRWPSRPKACLGVCAR
ncbi:hypothetical protein D9M69_539470 [compost metagenome]